MSRIYKVTTSKVSVSAVQDLMQIKAVAGKTLRIVRWEVYCTDQTPAASQMLPIDALFASATVTDGSGGSSPTPAAMPGDSAASFTAKANNTTQATTTGSFTTHWSGSTHLLSPLDYTPIKPIEVSLTSGGLAQSFILALTQAPTTAIHLTTTVTVEELGG